MNDLMRDRHAYLLNRKPLPEQQELYERVMEKRGFYSASSLSVEQERTLFEATFMVALSQTFRTKDSSGGNTYLFLPEPRVGWANLVVKGIAREIFSVCKSQKDADKARHLGELFQRLLIGSRVPEVAPAAWAAYGFSPDSNLPEWLHGAMLPVYPYLRDG